MDQVKKTTLETSYVSPLRYPGGKTRAVQTLSGYLPKDFSGNVLSPFIGGGSFELYLTSLGCKVNAFDAYAPLTNFWHWLLKNPQLLARRIRQIVPVNRDDFKTFQSSLKAKKPSSAKLAAKYLAVNRCSFSGATMSAGYSKSAATGRMTESIIKRIENFKNPLLQVSFGDFTQSMSSNYDFIFADPPYWLEKTSNKLYGSAGDVHSGFNHQLFYETITNIDSPWMLTYNNSSEIRKLYKKYDIKNVNWTYGMNSSKKSSEIVIRNYI